MMRRPQLGCVSLLLLLSASCKSDDPKGTESASKVAVRPGQEHPKGNLQLPSNEPRYLNPVLETRFNRANMLIFEGLVGLDDRRRPVPRLAKSWDMSADGKTLTFRLRENVQWSDGRPFTATDVAFTIDKIRTTKAPTLWRTYFAAVESIDTPDSATVIVTYESAYAPALVSWTVGILPAHRFQKQPFEEAPANTEPVGTGPFKLARWEKGTRMVLSANSEWWKGSPRLDSVELRFGLDDSLDALQAGELDFADIGDVNRWANQAQTPAFVERYEQTTAVESIFRTLAWNTSRAPFDDARVRRALTHALDRGRVVDDVLLGQAQLLSAPFFPNMFGADPSIAPWPFDLKRAEALLDESGHGAQKGTRFTVDVITLKSQKTAVNEEMFAIFKRDLRTIGVRLSLEYLDPVAFQEKLQKRDFDAVFFGWLRDIPDPDPSALLHSAQISGGQNFAGFAAKEIDAWLERAVATADRDERKALYNQIHERLHQEMPYTVLYAPFSHYAWSRHLRGVHPADVGPQTRFPGISGWSFRMPPR